MPGLPQPAPRFNLLLLDEGELYFEDYAAVYYLPGESKDKSLQRKVEGRIKLCSSSLLFVPKDRILPIIKFPFRSVERVDTWQGELFSIIPIDTDIVLLQSSLTIEVKENNRNAPYVFKHAELEHRFSLIYEPISQFLPFLLSLHSLSQLRTIDPNTAKEMLEHILAKRERVKPFDPSWFIHIMEQQQIEVRASRVTPFVSNPGRMVITDRALYFQLFNNIDPVPVSKVQFGSIHRICLRRHALRHIGLEIFFLPSDQVAVDSSGIWKSEGIDHMLESVFFSFKDKGTRDRVYSTLLEQAAISHVELNDLEDTIVKWQHGLISNFDYLLYLNSMAGRSYMDISQYPVFPWIICNYESDSLNLNDPKSFRDLSKPMGALNPSRLKAFQSRYEEIPKDQPRFLYGTHYSTPGYVLYYMVRRSPEYMLRLQNGKFDEPARLFYSMQATWNSVYSAPGDVKELIPEFFLLPDFLVNTQGLDLGNRPDGVPIADVALPPWAEDGAQFVAINRDALESPEVSKTLHLWIDLIFGSKQTGDAALKANNLFYPLTYEGAVDVETIFDPLERASLEAQIREFGQTPKQIFSKPHPPRQVESTKGWKYGTYARVETPSASWKNVSASSFPALSSSITSPLQPRHNSETLTRGSLSESWKISSQSDLLSPTLTRRVEETKAEKKVNLVHQWGHRGTFEFSYGERQHRGSVTSLCLSEDGDMVYSVGKDGRLKVYSISKQKLHRAMPVSEMPLSACVLGPRPDLVITASWDNNVYVYSMDCGRVIDRLYAHEDAVTCLDIKKETLISGSWDSTVRVWKCLGNGIDKNSSMYYELDDEVRTALLMPDGVTAAAGALDGSISFIDLREKKVVRTTHPHTDAVTGIHLGPNHNIMMSVSMDGNLRLTDLRYGELSAVSKGSPLWCLRSDGESALFGCTDGFFRQAQVKDGNLIEGETPEKKHKGPVYCLGVSRDGDVVVTGGEDTYLNIWKYIEDKQDGEKEKEKEKEEEEGD